eukprot:514137-Pelagomonas_calceolata.AAC.2
MSALNFSAIGGTHVRDWPSFEPWVEKGREAKEPTGAHQECKGTEGCTAYECNIGHSQMHAMSAKGTGGCMP